MKRSSRSTHLRRPTLAFPTARASLAAALFAALPLLAGCAAEDYRVAAVENRCSLHLDGRDDFVDVGRIGEKHPLLLAGSPFTVAAWFRQEPGGEPYERIIDKSDDVLGHNGWALAADPGERRVHFYVHDGRRGGDFISRAGAFRPGAWHYVTAVARATRLEIYLDGKRDRSASYEDGGFALPSPRPTSARIGNWNHQSGRSFRGWLDEISVWKTDLPPAAIGVLAAARGRADLRRDGSAYQASGDLVAWWRMEAGPDPAGAIEITDLVSTIGGRLMPDAASGNAPRVDCETIP
ncbi:MAG TPA: LamG domain-containing protein [Candidatus Polarisedimenticolia bacterium]|nr:LamG domain-containing protein [Candidatus Polarisedimenticolia bacterium]